MNEYAFLLWVLAAALLVNWLALGGVFIYGALAAAAVAFYISNRSPE